MKRKVFYTTIFTATLSLLAGMALIMGILYNYFSKLMINELSDETHYLATGIESNGFDYLSKLSVQNTKRITLISSDGTVIYDSDADIESMDNHSNRAEFIEAAKNGSATSERFSSTLSTKTVYYALKLSDGSILRSAYTQHTIWALIINMLPSMIPALLIVVFISAIIASILSKHILQPINKIDLNNPNVDDVYDEFIPFITKINHQNTMIKAQLEEMKQLDQMRQEFTSNVSHELKTPLTSISGMSELLMNGVVSKEDTQDFGKSIYDESARLISLVNDIIKLSQLDEGLVPSPKEPVDLYSLSEEILSRLRKTAAKRGIVLKLSGEPAIVSGVTVILDEMISNLCDNAIKYNKENGTVIVNISNTENGVSITVSDTGIGIPKEHLNRVFERFYRVDKSHSKQIGGTGLGLSIVKHAAIFHNAEFSIESEVGVGTSITISFSEK
ncbi:MAG: ATP-binding protein [Lachnospiraceae bacterium]|nr:ATP-binding protein [Lachnospiraceae bacterium]